MTTYQILGEVAIRNFRNDATISGAAEQAKAGQRTTALANWFRQQSFRCFQYTGVSMRIQKSVYGSKAATLSILGADASALFLCYLYRS